jgi:hypothetical protein
LPGRATTTWPGWLRSMAGCRKIEAGRLKIGMRTENDS